MGAVAIGAGIWAAVADEFLPPEGELGGPPAPPAAEIRSGRTAGDVAGTAGRSRPRPRPAYPGYLGRVVVEDRSGRGYPMEDGWLALEASGPRRSTAWTVPVRRGAFSAVLPTPGPVVAVRAELGGRAVWLRGAELVAGRPARLRGRWADVLVVEACAAEDDRDLPRVEVRAGQDAQDLLAVGPSGLEVPLDGLGARPLWISAPGRPARRVAHLPAGGRLRLRLPRAVGLEVRVVGAAAGAVVRCDRARARVDEWGRALLDGLWPGRDEVVVEQRGHELARARVRLAPGERRARTFVVERPGRVVGLVRRVPPGLGPLRVRLQARERTAGVRAVRTTPGPAGVHRFAFEDVVPGELQVLVEGATSRSVRLFPGGVAHLDLEFPAMSERFLEFFESDGRRAEVESVEWWPVGAPADPPMRAWRDGSGRIRVRAPDGELALRTDDGRLVRVTCPGGSPIRVRLPRRD